MATVQPTNTTTRRLWKRALIRLWVPLILVVAAFGMAGTVTAHHGPALSPVDEWVYVDYLIKLPEQGIVRQGEEIGLEAREIMACDGVKPFGPMGPACGTSYDDASKFPFKGITSADAYTPAYFAVTRVLGDAIHVMTGINQVASWRLTGAVWLALTVLLMYGLLRMWRISRPATLGLGLAFIASPFAWWTYTYVSTDAPSVVFGILLMMAAIRFGRGRGSGWWLPVIGVVAVIFKVTNILAVCLAALYLLILWITELKQTRWEGWRSQRPEHPDRYSLSLILWASAAVVASAGAQVAWLALRRSLAEGIQPDQAIGVPFTVQEGISQMVNFLPGTLTANVNLIGSTALAYAIPPFLVQPLSWICVTGVLGAFWTLTRKSDFTPFVISVFVAALLFAPMLAILIQVTTGSYFPLPPRYGAPILAAFLVCAGLILKNRWAVWLLVAYTIALYAFVVLRAPLLA